MVYCGRCGRTGHYISVCTENYSVDGERISKLTKAEKERCEKNKHIAVETRKGHRWTDEEEGEIEEHLNEYIQTMSKKLRRSENAVYIRMIKILEDMGDE